MSHDDDGVTLADFQWFKEHAPRCYRVRTLPAHDGTYQAAIFLRCVEHVIQPVFGWVPTRLNADQLSEDEASELYFEAAEQLPRAVRVARRG